MGFGFGLAIPLEDLVFGLDFGSDFFDLKPFVDLDPFDILVDLDFDGNLLDLDSFITTTKPTTSVVGRN